MPDVTPTNLHPTYLDDELSHDPFDVNNFYIFSDEPFPYCGSPEAGALGLDNPHWPTSTTPQLSAPTTPRAACDSCSPNNGLARKARSSTDESTFSYSQLPGEL
eukprot:3615737-Rhodomonas_salina.1